MHNNEFYRGVLFELTKVAWPDPATQAAPSAGPKPAATPASAPTPKPIQRPAQQNFTQTIPFPNNKPGLIQNALGTANNLVTKHVPMVQNYYKHKIEQAFQNPSTNAQVNIPSYLQKSINEVPELRQTFHDNVLTAAKDRIGKASIGELGSYALGTNKPTTGTLGMIEDYAKRDPEIHREATMAAIQRAPGAIWDWAKQNPGTAALGVLGTTGIAALIYNLFSSQPEQHQQAPVININNGVPGAQGAQGAIGQPSFM